MSREKEMPKDRGLDNTLKVLKEGYHYISNRKNKFNSRIFQTRLLGEKAIAMVGKEEASIFYDNDKFIRNGAAPKRIQKTLFGVGGVQGLDGKQHHHRKAMFMPLMTKETLKEIRSLTKEEWHRGLYRNKKATVSVYEMAKSVLARVAIRWVGIPVSEKEADKWADELNNMFEKAANVGPQHWMSRKSRSKTEDWLEDLVQKVRDKTVSVDRNRAVYQFSWHKDENGQLLDKDIVAVELLNLLRPIVAITVYVDLTVLAIHEFPDKTDSLRTSEEKELQYFIQEVRRYYPFFPFLVARVKQDFTWRDYPFQEGTLTLLDLYGTNHDPDLWENPHQFHPERFSNWEGDPFSFIPQGGGEFEIGHRCPGEWMTIEVLKETLDFFVNQITYEMPKQNLDYSMNDIPSLPKSGVIIKNIKAR